MLPARVAADPADVDLVGARHLARGRVGLRGRVVEHPDPGRALQDPPGLGRVGVGLQLDPHRGGVGDRHRHPHRGDAHAELGELEQAADLLGDLDLLLGVVAVHPPASGDHVAVEDVGVEVVRRDAPGGVVLLLDRQLGDQVPSRAARRLVGGDGEVAEPEGAVQRRQRHRQRDGDAIGVGDDPPVLAHPLPVDLGHDQGDRGVHPEVARLVDGDPAGGRDQGRVLLGGGRAGGEEDDVAAVEARCLHGCHRQLLTPEGDRAAHAAWRGEGAQLPHREPAVLEDAQDRGARGSGGTDQGDGGGGRGHR